MKIFGWGFAAVWITIWTVVTLGFDVMLVRGVAQEMDAQSWPTATGRVLSAEVNVQHDSEGGNSYTPVVTYAYSVNGAGYTCDRIRFGFKSSTKGSAARAMRTYPKGTEVTVHHNPQQPSEAVLETGVMTGADLFGTIFMTPFNAIMLAGWAMAWKALCGSDERVKRVGGFRVIEESGGVRLQLTAVTPLTAAVITAAGAAFALIFVIALTLGFESRPGAAAGWGVIVGASVLVYRRMRSRIDDGWYDLVINETRLTVTVPPSLKRADVEELRFDELCAVDVVKIPGSGDDSDSYHATLRWNSRGAHRVVLTKTTNQSKAEGLAKWLRERLYIDTSDSSSQCERATASLSTAG